MGNKEKTVRVSYSGKNIDVALGSNLRDVLLEHNIHPHNDKATFLNCRGLGSCGTCAVEINGKVHAKTKMEKWRLDFAPHKGTDGLRLACQVKVKSNIKVVKHEGFWGQLKFT